MDIEGILRDGSLAQLGGLLAQRKISSVEMAQWYLRRIEAHNYKLGAGLNAVRTLAPMGLEEAAAADAQIHARGVQGPLHGIPFLIKDNLLTCDGMPASAGARALAEFRPGHQATVVSRLRASGAILLGKTNLTEFADFVSDVMPAEFSGAGGVVQNPHGSRYDRGQGSSVGSAAAVAARFCGFAIGTETQNSIQTPALQSSIVGFKPSVGTVSRYGIVPLVPSQDSPGPLTRFVGDAARVFEVLAAADCHDVLTLGSRVDLSGLRQAVQLSTVRIGVPRRFMADTVLDCHNQAAFEQVLEALSAAGARLVDPCNLPSAQALAEVRSSVFRTEFKVALDSFLARHQAPGGIGSMAQLIAWNQAHPAAIPYGQSLLIAANQTAGLSDPSYREDRRRDIALSLTDGILAAMRENLVDVLLCPMSAAAKCTGKAGAPVIAIPVGLDQVGRPFGITVFAAPGQDARLLALAEAIETVVGQLRPVPF